MPRRKPNPVETEPKKLRPALTPEARENQMINLAMNLAEKQLMEGTASSQTICHFLKLATEKEKTEREILRLNKDLVQAKTEALQAAKRTEELYQNAIAAMRNYSGNGGDDDGEEDDEYYDD